MIRPLDPASYTSAGAFYAALEARLREASEDNAHRWLLMRTQFAISRLLARLQTAQPGVWVTKGGTSMLARLDGQCRLSRDLDLQCRDFADAGQRGLSVAARVDAGDWLRFRVEGDGRPLRQEELQGVRFRVSAWIGTKEFARFGVDIVDESEISGHVEMLPPYSPIALVQSSEMKVPLYPIEDHVADKTAAMGKVNRRGERVDTSTRYRDLADLALFATSVTIGAAPLVAALAEPKRSWAREAFGQTGLRLPGPEWPEMYAKTVRADPLVQDRWATAEAALAAAKPMVDPALAGRARGTWVPGAAAWRG